jgi:hypothetical protein
MAAVGDALHRALVVLALRATTDHGPHATAAQIERLGVAACRAITPEDVRGRHRRRSLSVRVDDDGSIVGSFRLAPEEGAVFLHGLRSAQGALGPRPEDDDDGSASAEASGDIPEQTERRERRSAADALVAMAETTLRAGEAAAPGPGADATHTTTRTCRAAAAARPVATTRRSHRRLGRRGSRLNASLAGIIQAST